MNIGEYVVYINCKFSIKTNTNLTFPVENKNREIENLYYRLCDVDNLAWFKIGLPESMRIKVVLDYEEVFRESNVRLDFGSYRSDPILWHPRKLSQILKTEQITENTAKQLEKIFRCNTKMRYYGEILVGRNGDCYRHDGTIRKVEKPGSIFAPFGKPKSYVNVAVEKYLFEKRILK